MRPRAAVEGTGFDVTSYTILRSDEMKTSIASRVVGVVCAIVFTACANPSEKNANTGSTGDTAPGTSSASVNASTGANVGATTTTSPSTGKDTGRAANDSSKAKTSTSGNPTGASSTRPTKP